MAAAWALRIVQRLEFLPGFPRTADGARAYAQQLQLICGTEKQADLLFQRVAAGADRFPTPIELRRIFSANVAKPADGIEAREADLADLMGRN
tara:strand:+ start:16439 stop:16717 length:279 start_codon:yes stop_codon:yes gene_type:complete